MTERTQKSPEQPSTPEYLQYRGLSSREERAVQEDLYDAARVAQNFLDVRFATDNNFELPIRELKKGATLLLTSPNIPFTALARLGSLELEHRDITASSITLHGIFLEGSLPFSPGTRVRVEYRKRGKKAQITKADKKGSR